MFDSGQGPVVKPLAGAATSLFLTGCSFLGLFDAPPPETINCGDDDICQRRLAGELGCFDAFCHPDTFTCALRPRDLDGDGYRPEGCRYADGVTGDDCNDELGAGAAVFPGATEICNGIDDDCNDATDEDPASTSSCPTFPNTVMVCRDGGCVVTMCPGQTGDCDMDASNGCETDTTSDVQHCGGCGASCFLQCRDSACDEAVDVQSGGRDTCVRQQSGRVACWGDEFGVRPISITGIEDAVDLGAGGSSACAVRESGRVSCWGLNSEGQLGDGTRISRTSPVDAIGVSMATRVGVGAIHACAVDESGGLWCWGDNTSGQIGDGTTMDRDTAVAVPGLPPVADVDGGEDGMSPHTCALLRDGRAACWGTNMNGQLGDGTRTGQASPVFVTGLTDAVAISTGIRHTCAVGATGEVVCWGHNTDQMLGVATATVHSSPVAVAGLSDAEHITVGERHSCALRRDGVVMCWGSDMDGVRGHGMMMSPGFSPTPTSLMEDSMAVAAGVRHTCALTTSNQVFCWGTPDRLGSSGGSGDAPAPVDPIEAETGGCGGCDGGMCMGTTCVCEPGAELCDGVCIDVGVDRLNCGRCGNDCRSGSCDMGVCVRSCDVIRQDCAGVEACIASTAGPICAPPGSAREGMRCMFLNDCLRGQMCFVDAPASGTNACATYCDLAGTTAPCMTAGRTCIPLAEIGLTARGTAGVGLCLDCAIWASVPSCP